MLRIKRANGWCTKVHCYHHKFSTNTLNNQIKQKIIWVYSSMYMHLLYMQDYFFQVLTMQTKGLMCLMINLPKKNLQTNMRNIFAQCLKFHNSYTEQLEEFNLYNYLAILVYKSNPQKTLTVCILFFVWLITIGEVVLGNWRDKAQLKELSSTQLMTVWHDHSDICGELLPLLTYSHLCMYNRYCISVLKCSHKNTK